MAQVILSFDTEDYTSEYSNAAARDIAGIMTSEGIKGSFNVVGEAARHIASSPDRSCLEALGRHEINYHSLRHSWHPTIVEYCDTEDWKEGYRRFLEEETKGIGIVKKSFNVERLWAAVPPGNSITMQAVYGYRQLGIPIYSGSLFKGTKGRGIWFCGALNLENNLYIEDLLLGGKLDETLAHLDQLASWDRVIICGHPNMSVYRQFWDALNMKGANVSPWGDWKEAERRTTEEVEGYRAGFRRLLRELKNHGGFRFVTYRDVYEEMTGRSCSCILQEDMPDVMRKAVGRFFYFLHRDTSYSLADAFFAAAHFLQGNRHPFMPNGSLGPVEPPEGIRSPVFLSSGSVRMCAARIDPYEPVPSALDAGGVRIGPGDFLRAAKEVFEGAESFELLPGPSVPDVSGFYDMDRFRLKNTWMYSDAFEDNWVLRRLMQQAWTIKLESVESPQ